MASLSKSISADWSNTIRLTEFKDDYWIVEEQSQYANDTNEQDKQKVLKIDPWGTLNSVKNEKFKEVCY